MNRTAHWFWAKLGHETWPEKYHPVICHLIDVGQVALALWQQSVRLPLRSRVAVSLGLPDADVGRWLAFWVAAHDIGKLTPCFQFQGKTEELKTRLTHERFSLDTAGNPHHTETGTQILACELTRVGQGWSGLPRELARKVAVAVGGHHGTFPTTWDGIQAPLGNDEWGNARRELLDQLARLFGVRGLSVPNPSPGGDQSVWMYLAGLTSVADWIGSNVEFFPPFVTPDFPLLTDFDVDRYFRTSAARAACALQTLGWLDRAEPTGTPVSFRQATGIAEPRALQTAVIPLAQEMAAAHQPRLVLVEAPMGEGKTEAAWYVADCWDRCGGQGTYVALPTMATSNQMFNRVGTFLGSHGEGKKNLMLQHGKAALNKQFEKLKYAARTYDPDGNTSGVVAEGWFAANKKHGLLAPFGVGTIDQSLLAVLQTKHVFVRLFGLAGKCVILDEVHAYDAYMTTLMERLLRWLAALGCPVVLLSATLPADKRLKLLRAYAGDETAESESQPYPRVTSVTVGDTPSVIPFEADPTRNKKILLEWVEDDDLVRNLKRDLETGGCVAVIRNTVGLAQDTYPKLKQEFAAEIEAKELTVELFHARFPFGRRKQIEDDVLAKYGKGTDGKPENPLRPKKAILVATQVIEQSLDLDFDVMYSDVAPVDLVLQRAGRLHRHDRGDRGQPRLRLIAPGEKGGAPDFGPSEWVYARFVLLRSLIALRACPVVALPRDLERLVEQIYGQEPLCLPGHYSQDLAKSEKIMRERCGEQYLNATEVSIDDPDQDQLGQQSAELDEEDPSVNVKIQAATRDADPSIRLVLVYQLHGSDFLDADGKEPFEETQVPDVTRMRRLIDNEVTISHSGYVRWYAARHVPSGWKKCGLLRHHRLVRLDCGGSSLPVSEFPLRYRFDLGVQFV